MLSKVITITFLLLTTILLSTDTYAQFDFNTIKLKLFNPNNIAPTTTLSPPAGANTPTPIGGSGGKCDKLTSQAGIIANSLSKGFWNEYNKSSLYPELFNDALFTANPNPTPSTLWITDLFWCTYLIMKSYDRASFENITNGESVYRMKPWFETKNRYLPKTAKTSELSTGTAIFFEASLLAGGSTLSHVAMITDIKKDFVTITESNAAAKTRTLTVGNNSVIQEGSTIINGYGLPPKDCK